MYELIILQNTVVVSVVMLHQRVYLAVRELEVSQYVTCFVKRDPVVPVCVHPLEDVLQF